MAYTFNGDEYRNAKTGGERLAPGGHRCIIKKITLGKSKNGKDQFVVMFDTAADDSQPCYFMNRFLDTQKWGGNYYLTAGNDYFVGNVKKLCGAIEASNDGFVAGDFSEDGSTFEFRFEDIVDKEVGIVFREEEYEPKSGIPDKWPTSAKPYYFCDVKNAQAEPVPEIRRLEKPAAGQNGAEGFMQVRDDYEGLPFR